ncbi:hypothetical protein CHISP_2581 [Chitinispirillum alkaliphilum]|nr:hypothetical protein CHISP_2581 [Chitinispirillum alkaliphilum]
MSKKVLQTLRKMVLLERKIGLLYSYFQDIFTEDKAFWQQLTKEETEHATLIETHIEYINDFRDKFKILLESSEDNVEEIINKITVIINDLGKHVKTREDALLLALQMEQSAGELHFQNTADFQDYESEIPIPIQIFQSLAQSDKDHAIKISKYLESIR